MKNAVAMLGTLVLCTQVGMPAAMISPLPVEFVDPESLMEPVTVTWDWIDIGEESLHPVTCE